MTSLSDVWIFGHSESGATSEEQQHKKVRLNMGWGTIPSVAIESRGQKEKIRSEVAFSVSRGGVLAPPVSPPTEYNNRSQRWFLSTASAAHKYSKW